MRLKKQLKHDSNEKYKERLGSLRKDVYLQIYSSICEFQMHMGSLASKDPSSPEFAQPFQELSSQLSRVQLVGGQEVAQSAGRFAAAATESMFRLMVAAQPLQWKKIEINLSDKSYNQFYEKADNIISAMNAERESGTPSKDRLDELRKSLENYTALYTQHSTERSDRWREYLELQKDFRKSATSEARKIAPEQAALYASIKNELGIPTDSGQVLQDMIQIQDRVEESAQSLLAHFDAQKG